MWRRMVRCIRSIETAASLVLVDWARLLRPSGRLLFTDPLTVTGPLGSDEIAIRTSIG